MSYILTTLRVSDIEESLSFYRDLLSMPVIREFTNKKGIRIAMLGREDEPHLELVEERDRTSSPEAGGISVGFDVEGAEALLGKIGRAYTGPVMPHDKLRFYFTTDPDGYTVQLLEHLA